MLSFSYFPCWLYFLSLYSSVLCILLPVHGTFARQTFPLFFSSSIVVYQPLSTSQSDLHTSKHLHSSPHSWVDVLSHFRFSLPSTNVAHVVFFWFDFYFRLCLLLPLRFTQKEAFAHYCRHRKENCMRICYNKLTKEGCCSPFRITGVAWLFDSFPFFFFHSTHPPRWPSKTWVPHFHPSNYIREYVAIILLPPDSSSCINTSYILYIFF
jgi:hypothetical protein